MFPLESAIIEPTFSLLNEMVVKLLKPLPVIVTDVPGVPELGLNDIAAAATVTVKDADAVSPATSVAVTA
jgi:hypothetical protein